MPCHAARCRQLVRRGKGIKKWRKGLMFLQLTERADGVVQEVVLGVDPGSKKEAFTIKPENHTFVNLQADAVCLVPLRWHRRQLHRFQPGKGGIRQPYGGTHSLGFKRGSLVRHILRHGLSYVGGTLKGRLSLHSLVTGQRLCRNARPEDCTFLTRLSWRLTPALSSAV